MNYFAKLKTENDNLKIGIENAIAQLIEYQRYYNSQKFAGIEIDYAHVSTDVYPKFTEIKTQLQEILNQNY